MAGSIVCEGAAVSENDESSSYSVGGLAHHETLSWHSPQGD